LDLDPRRLGAERVAPAHHVQAAARPAGPLGRRRDCPGILGHPTGGGLSGRSSALDEGEPAELCSLPPRTSRRTCSTWRRARRAERHGGGDDRRRGSRMHAPLRIDKACPGRHQRSRRSHRWPTRSSPQSFRSMTCVNF
jgi:hypothetical protein